jgi:serine/threonine-protein kinase HipA
VSAPNQLQVLLGSHEVGLLELESGGLDVVRFTVTEGYRRMANRPVLSQALEEDLDQVWSSRVRAPAFFSNLLPEGVLRELLAQRAGVNPIREFFLLAELGEDLPGNVVIRPLGALDANGEVAAELPAPTVGRSEALRFSVAGLQLKFSVNPRSGGWVLPIRGAGGRWLAKLPSRRFVDVPRNEFLMMRFAREVGLDVPDVELASVDHVEGLTPLLDHPTVSPERTLLLVRRFDRTDGPERIHTEDMLQVLNKHPGEDVKYRAANAEWVTRLILALAPDQWNEVVRRLVFNVVIGNGDAHLKNWMLRYEPGSHARLSPAFDLVSTIQYPDTDQNEFALNLGRSKRYDEFTAARLVDFAKKLMIPVLSAVAPTPDEVVAEARAFAQKTMSRWSSFAEEHEVPKSFSSRLEEHWTRVPFLSG